MSTQPAVIVSPPASQTRPAQIASPPPNHARQVTQVIVTDIDMPFTSMVSFMVKWTLATIPAMFILAIVGGMIWMFVAGLIRGH